MVCYQFLHTTPCLRHSRRNETSTAMWELCEALISSSTYACTTHHRELSWSSRNQKIYNPQNIFFLPIFFCVSLPQMFALLFCFAIFFSLIPLANTYSFIYGISICELLYGSRRFWWYHTHSRILFFTVWKGHFFILWPVESVTGSRTTPRSMDDTKKSPN